MSQSSRATQIIVSLIAAGAAIVVGYWQFFRHPTDDRRQFTGRVVNAEGTDKIRGAMVSLEVRGVPPILYTDSEGIFSFPLKDAGKSIRLVIEANGYKKYDRRIDPDTASGVEEIRLSPDRISTGRAGGSGSSDSQVVKVRPDGVNGSSWWGGNTPACAFDGNLRTYWSTEESKARGAWIEFLIREPKILSSLRLYTPPGSTGDNLKELTLIGDNGARRKIRFRGLSEWEDIDFEPLQATTLRLEVDELRNGTSGSLEVYELEFFGK